MTELPTCKFRGNILDGERVQCSCPSLIQLEQGVSTISTCLHPCPYRDEATEKATKKESPPLHVKAMNFLTSLSRHAIAGFPVVDAETYEKRLSICMACDMRHPIRQMECTECGCPVEEKASWAKESCPLKKWLAEASAAKHGKSGCGGCGGK